MFFCISNVRYILAKIENAQHVNVVWMFNTFITPQLGQETMLRMEERNTVQRGQQWLDQRMYDEELMTATPDAAASVASPAPQPVGE